MNKIFVIAGTKEQAKDYIRRKMDEAGNETSFNDYVIVTNSTALRGMDIEHGVFVGTWRNLPNLDELFQTLIIHSRMNPIIRSVYENWKNENISSRIMLYVNGSLQAPNTSYKVDRTGNVTFTNPVYEYVQVDIRSITDNPQIHHLVVGPGDTINLKLNTEYIL